MIRSFAFAILIAMSSLPAGGAELAGRYVLEKVEDGFLRLDRDSGAIAHCALNTGEWICSAVKDETATLAAENLRLREENELLKKQLANSYTVTLPSDRDIERFKAIFSDIADSFMGFAAGLGG
jgi:hypothetical protein